ncbi:hypothetical protein Tco_0381933 [Tanacetum coccineum]
MGSSVPKLQFSISIVWIVKIVSHQHLETQLHRALQNVTPEKHKLTLKGLAIKIRDTAPAAREVSRRKDVKDLSHQLFNCDVTLFSIRWFHAVKTGVQY